VSRSLPLLLVGAWLGLLVSSWVMASVNFRTAERVAVPASAPELHARLDPLPPADRRLALRYIASEINRWMFRWAAVAQAALGMALVALLWRAGGVPRGLALCALGVVAVQLGVLAPMIAAVGRAIDFMPRPLPPAIGRRFGLLHGGYVLLDFAKALLLCGAAFVLARR
jgi:hypothetical protein